MKVYKLKLVRQLLGETDNPTLHDPASVARYALDNLFDPDEMYRESAYAVFTDHAGRVLGHYLVGVGGVDSVTTDIRLVSKTALDALATGVILLHNHPSGDPRPSSSDIERTKRLKSALAVFDIRLIDHVVIGDGKIYSFTEETIINLFES